MKCILKRFLVGLPFAILLSGLLWIICAVPLISIIIIGAILIMASIFLIGELAIVVYEEHKKIKGDD